ncbi:MAG: OmpA family protein, partial [Rhodospirillales bacterium]|nr:OmpA family protein [Rhodospirillales bacterium]
TRRDPKWLMSFADLMALLVALFVMLLSFSEVDSDSFRKNAGPISEAFNQKPKIINIVPAPLKTSTQQVEIEAPKKKEDQTQSPQQVAFRLRVLLADELKKENIEIMEKDDGVTIRFRDQAAFAPGDRELSSEILPSLEKITEVLEQTRGSIRVEGHTDDVPISSGSIRSNWDLSATRAASVVHQFLKSPRIDPKRVSAQGYADSRPLAPNDSAANRAKNRRVEVTLDISQESVPAVTSRINRWR